MRVTLNNGPLDPPPPQRLQLCRSKLLKGRRRRPQTLALTHRSQPPPPIRPGTSGDLIVKVREKNKQTHKGRHIVVS